MVLTMSSLTSDLDDMCEAPVVMVMCSIALMRDFMESSASATRIEL